MQYPNEVELLATDLNKLTNERSWFVLPKDTDQPIYAPDTSGEGPSLKACETWLANRGYVAGGQMPPECYEYTRDKASFVHAAEAFMATCAPDLNYNKADLFGFINAAWPYDGEPEDAASQFVEEFDKE